jgi:hypothetical protein
MTGRCARWRRRLWARRGWGGQCVCLFILLASKSIVRVEDGGLPGAVWRRGWVDMTIAGRLPRKDVNDGYRGNGWSKECSIGSNGFLYTECS